jgi:putative membrane protein
MTAETLPAINATLNSIATILLVVGLVLIRRKNHRAHGYTMATALCVSAAFLVCYLAHKAMFGDRAINRFYPDIPQAWKYVYWFVILIPHLILAVGMLPFIAKGLWHAYKRQWDKHRAVNRVTIWVWLYVSITGVVIYWLLYHHFPALQQQANPGFVPPSLT